MQNWGMEAFEKSNSGGNVYAGAISEVENAQGGFKLVAKTPECG